jgi:hypothetical protein
MRRQGAQGDLAVSVLEKIEILVFLSTDRDAEVSRQALHTLRHWNPQELDQVLSDPSTSTAVIDFVFDRMLEEQADLRDALAQSPGPGALPLLAETNGFEAGSTEPVSGSSEPTATPKSEPEPESAGAAGTATRPETLLQRIAHMAVPQRVRLALLGSQEERFVLIRDPNRVVVRSVVQSPRVSESEIESFAAMRDVKEEVLRIISKNRAFIKNPGVVRALVFNPRSPIDVSLPLIKLLKDRDLKVLTIDKNVPDAVRSSAVRLYFTRTHNQGR